MSQSKFAQGHFGPSHSGLATVGYTLQGGSRTTTGVAEVATGTGSYGVTLSLPDAGFTGAIIWDTGGASPITITGTLNVANDVVPANVTEVNGAPVSAVSGAVAANLTQVNGTAVSGANVPANVTEINGTAVASVGGVIDANITEVNGSAVQAVSGVIDVNVTEINGNSAAAAAFLAQLRAQFLGVVSADATPTSTTFTANATGSPGLSTTAGDYVNSVVAFYGGANAPAARKVTGYTVNGSVGTFTVDIPLPAIPSTSGSDTFLILGYAP